MPLTLPVFMWIRATYSQRAAEFLGFFPALYFRNKERIFAESGKKQNQKQTKQRQPQNQPIKQKNNTKHQTQTHTKKTPNTTQLEIQI